MRGYVELPEGWERVSADGPGPFVTSEVLRRPDGTEVTWQSRVHRKASPQTDGSRAQSIWWRPTTRGWWMSVLFMIGSACFLVGGVVTQWSSGTRSGIGIVFFVGSIFFTSAAYLQYSETVNVDHVLTPDRRRKRWRPVSWEPGRIDWLAAVIQLIGTVFFNVSTFAALNHSLSTHQINTRVWAPDVFGSAAFLVSSELAFAEVGHRWLSFRNRTLSWWIVALNLFGSIAFGFSAVASLTEPASGQAVSARLANAGTSVGGVCFLIGALLLLPEAARHQAKRAKLSSGIEHNPSQRPNGTPAVR